MHRKGERKTRGKRGRTGGEGEKGKREREREREREGGRGGGRDRYIDWRKSMYVLGVI